MLRPYFFKRQKIERKRNDFRYFLFQSRPRFGIRNILNRYVYVGYFGKDLGSKDRPPLNDAFWPVIIDDMSNGCIGFLTGTFPHFQTVFFTFRKTLLVVPSSGLDIERGIHMVIVYIRFDVAATLPTGQQTNGSYPAGSNPRMNACSRTTSFIASVIAPKNSCVTSL